MAQLSLEEVSKIVPTVKLPDLPLGLVVAFKERLEADALVALYAVFRNAIDDAYDKATEVGPSDPFPPAD